MIQVVEEKSQINFKQYCGNIQIHGGSIVSWMLWGVPIA